MVVRFPSGSQGDPGKDASNASAPGAAAGPDDAADSVDSGVGDHLEGAERLAPVTPLRRAAGGSARASRGSASPRPVAELPFAASGPGDTSREESADGAGAGAEPGMKQVSARGGVSVGAHPAGRGSRWNNTWGEDAPARAAAVSGGRTFPGAAEPTDEETERQSRKANAVTIRQLARRGMSRWELEQVLIKREIEPEVFAPELDRLEALGVIDDASLATSLAFTQHSRKGLGRSAIELDLKRRHIAPELIQAALADIEDDDELEMATELAIKRIGQLSSYDDETARRRLHGFLARKGYDSGVVRQAMEAAFATRRRRGVRFE